MLFQICLNGSFNLSSPLLPGGTAEEYLQILGQLLTSCLESCQPSHVPVSEINIAPQIGMLGNPTYPGFMVMKYPTDLSGRQSNIQLISTKKRSQMSALIFPQRRRRNQLDSIGLTREKENLGILFLGLHKLMELMGYHEISRHWLKPSCYVSHVSPERGDRYIRGNKFFSEPTSTRFYKDHRYSKNNPQKSHVALSRKWGRLGCMFAVNFQDYKWNFTHTKIPSSTKQISKGRRGRRSEGSLFTNTSNWIPFSTSDFDIDKIFELFSRRLHSIPNCILLCLFHILLPFLLSWNCTLFCGSL